MNKFLSLVEECALHDTTVHIEVLDRPSNDEMIVQAKVSALLAGPDHVDYDVLAAQLVKTLCSLEEDDEVHKLGAWMRHSFNDNFNNSITFGCFSDKVCFVLPFSGYQAYMNKSLDVSSKACVASLVITIWIDSHICGLDELQCSAIDGQFA